MRDCIAREERLPQADVLIDSQAPVIGEVLRWCAEVCGKPDFQCGAREARIAALQRQIEGGGRPVGAAGGGGGSGRGSSLPGNTSV